MKENNQKSTNMRRMLASFNLLRDKTLILNDQYQWIGCNEEGCKFWAYAFSAGIQIGKKDPKNIDFFCPNHIKS